MYKSDYAVEYFILNFFPILNKKNSVHLFNTSTLKIFFFLYIQYDKVRSGFNKLDACTAHLANNISQKNRCPKITQNK